MYREYKEGRGNVTTLQPVRFVHELQLLLYAICDQVVEDSSEIASAQVSSIYRKSMKRTKFQNKQQTVLIINNSLSKISEENTDAIVKHLG